MIGACCSCEKGDPALHAAKGFAYLVGTTLLFAGTAALIVVIAALFFAAIAVFAVTIYSACLQPYSLIYKLPLAIFTLVIDVKLINQFGSSICEALPKAGDLIVAGAIKTAENFAEVFCCTSTPD